MGHLRSIRPHGVRDATARPSFLEDRLQNPAASVDAGSPSTSRPVHNGSLETACTDLLVSVWGDAALDAKK